MAEAKPAALTSMKRPRDERDGEAPVSMHQEYGWGLQLRLENFELDKLGMKLPKVGQELRIVAVAKVVSVHQSAHRDTGEDETKSDRGVQLQITQLAIDGKK